MFDALLSALAFIVAISVLVAVHEYGHFLVGRLCGMKVLRFSIGFGKPVWTRIGAAPDRTEYCISAIPLGGYVRFLDSREAEIAPQDAHRAFNHRPIPARIAVLVAGPAFNFLFAVLAYWALFVYGVPEMWPTVGEVEPDSYAAEAGLEFGDRIVAVGDKEVGDWESALVQLLDGLVANGRVELRLEDASGAGHVALLDVGSDVRRLTEPGMLFDGLGFQPWSTPAVVGEITPGSAAEQAGLRPGDRILAINGEPVDRFQDMPRILEPLAGAALTLDISRDGETLSLHTVAGSAERKGATVGQLGITPQDDAGAYWYTRKFGPLESIGHAAERTWQSSVFTVNMLGRMIVGDVSIKNISGPINIAQFAGASAQAGIGKFLGFLAIVSISLGVLNLIPLPILDGGQIVYQLIELVKGSPLSERAQLVGQQVGIFALLLLMSFAFYNDIARILG